MALFADFLRCSLLTYGPQYAVACVLKIGKIAHGGMPTTYEMMH